MRIKTPFITTLFGLMASLAQAEPSTKIVVDIPATYQIIERIVGEEVQIDVLFSPEFSGHHFSLKPSQAETIAEADYIFGIGSVLAPSIVRAADSLQKPGAVVAFYDDNYLAAGKGEYKIENHDPHLWLSPDHLSQMDKFYRETLSSDIAPIEFDVPHSDVVEVPILTSHQAFDYFENYTGFRSQGALHDNLDHAVSPRKIAEISKKIAAGEIRCLLIEAGEYSQGAAQFAKENELSVQTFDIMGWEFAEAPDFFSQYFDSLVQAYQVCD